MDNQRPQHDNATSNVLAWTTTHSANVEPLAEEDAADADEPPDCLQSMSPMSNHFAKRTPAHHATGRKESLLTKAFQSHSDEETHESGSFSQRRRRRSVTSNFSFASTTDYSCDTGFTTPTSTSSHSPRLLNAGFMPFAATILADVAKTPVPTNSASKDLAVQVLEKKRTISFACVAKPDLAAKAAMPPPQVPAKKTTIKFACPGKPQRDPAAPQKDIRPMTPVPSAKGDNESQWSRSSSTPRLTRSPTARKPSTSLASTQNKKWLTANPNDLDSECAHFHEFASEEPREDDWIRRDDVTSKPKITIQDTLQKENVIRKLGKEAEEEAELEEELENAEVDEEEDDDDQDGDENDEGEDEESPDGDEDEDLDDEVDVDYAAEDDLEDDAATEYAWDDEASDGYKTDSEIGFAESDDEDDDLVLWTTRIGHHPTLSGAVIAARRQSMDSDSSACGRSAAIAQRKKRSRSSRPVRFQPATPELPDSTDFVCGTFDEDLPLEEAYISCVEARKREKLKPIPQDIDPSFPTSEPEDEDEDGYGNAHGDSDHCAWLHGEFEDLHEDLGRRGRKKVTSPKRFQSPPPKRRNSPAPKYRGRSPRKQIDQSPRRMRSPAPYCMANKSPLSNSPSQDSDGIAYKSLAFRPGLRSTKSLPKAPGMFPHFKARKPKSVTSAKEHVHVRGAIDIVKGLEAKRARRKEKFYQKYCSRARKEKTHPKRPLPGQGVERMRELGLIMAGKAAPGHYVLSI